MWVSGFLHNGCSMASNLYLLRDSISAFQESFFFLFLFLFLSLSLFLVLVLVEVTNPSSSQRFTAATQSFHQDPQHQTPIRLRYSVHLNLATKTIGTPSTSVDRLTSKNAPATNWESTITIISHAIVVTKCHRAGISPALTVGGRGIVRPIPFVLEPDGCEPPAICIRWQGKVLVRCQGGTEA